MSNETQGRRVYPDDEGHLLLAEGDYGKNPLDGVWYARPPGFHMGSLKNHDVEEHEDGTITVTPSILITSYDNDCEIKWHGWLQGGMWRDC